jgi:hypothetical protein
VLTGVAWVGAWEAWGMEMQAMSGLLGQSVLLADGEEVMKIVIIGGLIVGGILLYKLIEVVGGVMRAKQAELTRREIAAYVAEGGMTPETAERLLKAGAPNDWPQHVATMVQCGSIDSNEAERLLKAGPAGSAAAQTST